jgi:hypothetical protein
MKIQFHFARVPDADITTEGDNPGDCFQKAVEERGKQFEQVKFPATGGKEITEPKTLVNPV